MTLPDLHLNLEAVAALVDDELSLAARGRALAHLSCCPQCRDDVAIQRQAKRLLVGAGGPALPDALLARLREIPFSTVINTPDVTMSMHGEAMLSSAPPRPPGAAGTASSIQLTPPMPPRQEVRPVAPMRPAMPLPEVRPAGPSRPANRRPGMSPARLRRLRRGIVGAVAGLTVGVLGTVGPVTFSANGGLTAPRTVGNTQLPDLTSFTTPLNRSFPEFAGLVSRP